MATLTKRPIQVYLEERQERALRRLAADENTSLADLIRRAVGLWLAQVPVDKDPAWNIIALGDPGAADLAARHDDYLVEELSKETDA